MSGLAADSFRKTKGLLFTLEHCLLAHPSEEILCVGGFGLLCFGGLFCFFIIGSWCLFGEKEPRYL